MASWFVWERQPMRAKKGQLVPVAALKHDLSGDNVEEPAAAKIQGVAPLKDGPFAVFEDVLDYADPLRRGETDSEHLSNRGAAVHWRLGDLMVHRVVRI